MTKKTAPTNATTTTSSPSVPQTWIRGVNIGGWLVAEPFITPYLFAVNSCHVRGDFCWYPGQIGAPRTTTTEADGNDVNICDPKRCEPILPILDRDGEANYHPLFPKTYMNYPIDEYTLGQTFAKYGVEDEFGEDNEDEGVMNDDVDSTKKTVGQRYMERHWDTFLTKDDLLQLHDAGVTHLRVPMGYWIRGGKTADIEQVYTNMKWDDTEEVVEDVEDEQYISGSWPYFQRMVQWCREINAENPTKPPLHIWPDFHGAPGSQNGFDNSGKYSTVYTCKGWSDNIANVQRTLGILQELTQAIKDDNMTDIVTGFGVLNEPFFDCNEDVLREFYNTALEIVRNTMGQDTAVFIGDKFHSWNFNDGWWTATSAAAEAIEAAAKEKAAKAVVKSKAKAAITTVVDDSSSLTPLLSTNNYYSNTYLDSHPYYVFSINLRGLTPRQHIAYVCQHAKKGVESCCYEDKDMKSIPSLGISRLYGEWSGAFDTLPSALVPVIMKTIKSTGKAPYLERQLNDQRRGFLRNFVQAQMVTYESKSIPKISSGWLFWNFKMEYVLSSHCLRVHCACAVCVAHLVRVRCSFFLFAWFSMVELLYFLTEVEHLRNGISCVD